MPSEPITLDGRQYRIGERKLSAMEQFHVTRRLGPAVVIAGVSLKMILDGKNVSMDAFAGVAAPVMDVISHMSDEDVEYVIYKCMRCVERMQGGVWAPVTSPSGKDFMFADMDQAAMIRMTWEVLQVDLANFARGMDDGGSLTEESAATDRPRASFPST